MNSSQLIMHLKKQGISQYRIARLLGISDSQVSHIKTKKQNFSADHLGKLNKDGLIDNDTVLKVNYYDNLRDKKLFKNVAALMLIPAMQLMSQLQEVYDQLCILC